MVNDDQTYLSAEPGVLGVDWVAVHWSRGLATGGVHSRIFPYDEERTMTASNDHLLPEQQDLPS